MRRLLEPLPVGLLYCGRRGIDGVCWHSRCLFGAFPLQRPVRCL